MCNCNQKRSLFNKHDAAKRAQFEAMQGMVQARLIQKGPLKVNGDITGRTYQFKEKEDILWIDKRDLPGIEKAVELQLL